VLAECLRSWLRGDDDIDSDAAAYVVAETVIRVRLAHPLKGE